MNAFLPGLKLNRFTIQKDITDTKRHSHRYVINTTWKLLYDLNIVAFCVFQAADAQRQHAEADVERPQRRLSEENNDTEGWKHIRTKTYVPLDRNRLSFWRDFVL